MPPYKVAAIPFKHSLFDDISFPPVDGLNSQLNCPCFSVFTTAPVNLVEPT